MLNTPPHLEARDPRGFVSIFHGTSSSVARRWLRASDLSFRQSMPSFDIGRPGLQMQSGASAVLGGVGELPGSRCTDFDPRAPCGARHVRPVSLRLRRSFQSTRPVWGATLQVAQAIKGYALFQSTRPVWGATLRRGSHSSSTPFQSTRPVWGATFVTLTMTCSDYISIHAPRVGRDGDAAHAAGEKTAFQSTRPVWGATACCGRRRLIAAYFNPRAPCGARPSQPLTASACVYFNPRAPCGARPRFQRKRCREF